jgi:16S rRNA (cytidine1402-2'-O)-methyltransferase
VKSGKGAGRGRKRSPQSKPPDKGTLGTRRSPGREPDLGQSDAHDQGVLYVCGTPIGNLEDITLRALRILKEVDLIAAEDTRRTLGLLNHYDISKPLVSYHEHNKDRSGPLIITKLKEGNKVALVTDAGMPGISDPGQDLVRLARIERIGVEVVPGPSAVLAALASSGMAIETFTFSGFLPRKRADRVRALSTLKEENRHVVIYEAPHRVLATLRDILEVYGDIEIALAREMTKLHEETLVMRVSQVLDTLSGNKLRGEITIIIGSSCENKNESM